MAKDMQKACIYKCRQFNEIYNISHEFFPIALDEEYSYSSTFNIKENVFINQYDELINEIENLKDKYNDNILKSKINMFFSYARFYKSIGQFEKAVEKLNEILVLSESLDYFKAIFKVHLQFIQYAININDLKMMNSHIKELKNKYKDMMDELEYAIYLRFSGYYDILNHNFKDANKKIDQAQDIFKNQKNLYKMKFNIAACTFIKGEEKFLQDKFDEAFDYYLESISICHDTEVHPSLGLLFSRLGLVKLKQNLLDEAKYYLEKALKQYDSTGFFWGKRELYKHLSEVYILKGDSEKYNYYKSIAM